MNDTETDFNEDTDEKKPRKARKRNEDRRVFVYRMIDGKPKEQGAFPETVIGTPLERRSPVFLRELFGEGDYRLEIRKPNGHFERAFDISIAAEADRADRERQNIIEAEPEIEEIEDEFDFQDNQHSNDLQLRLLIEKEKTRRLETELQATRAGSQNEMQTTVSALERAYEQNRELMMMMLSQSQKPQQDATTQAMNLLEKSFGMVTKARAISDELAPSETSSNGSSFFGDAAKLVDSLGQNAGKLLPVFLGNRVSVPAARPTTKPKAAQTHTTNGSAQGELTNLLDRVKSKKEGSKK